MERTADRRCAKKGIIRLKIERFRHRCNAVHADTIRSLVGDGDTFPRVLLIRRLMWINSTGWLARACTEAALLRLTAQVEREPLGAARQICEGEHMEIEN